MKSSAQVERPIESRILVVRGQRVMLDTDLATLYGVEAKVLNQAVRRNVDRFPADFMFQLSWEELERSRSQFVTLNGTARERPSRGHNVKYRPFAFTEHGVAMLSSVLRSKQARELMAPPQPPPKRRIGFVSEVREQATTPSDPIERNAGRPVSSNTAHPALGEAGGFHWSPAPRPRVPLRGQRPPLTSVVGGRF